MPETYSLIVATGDGKLLIQKEITGDLFDLSCLLSSCSHALTYQLRDIVKSKTEPGSGIILPASHSS